MHGLQSLCWGACLLLMLGALSEGRTYTLLDALGGSSANPNGKYRIIRKYILNSVHYFCSKGLALIGFLFIDFYFYFTLFF